MSVFDEFKIVTRRRKSKRILRGVHRLTAAARNQQQSEDLEIDLERVKRAISAAVEQIDDSEYRDTLLGGLDEALSSIGASDLPEIICYGLGNFSQSRASKFQLAALLTIKSSYNSNVNVYDPLFLRGEIEILEDLGLRPIADNEEAKRTIGGRTSLVYMPHCPYQLTNNFIYANWSLENLINCLVLSNSFNELVDSIFSKDLEESTNYISRIQPYATEIALENNFEYGEVFNGSSIHIFRRKSLERVSSDFWDRRESPIYSTENCEFVKRSNSPLEEI